MNAYQQLLRRLERQPKVWLVTGAAGFIGSNIVEVLLRHGQRVVGLDSFATSSRRNLGEVREIVGKSVWKCFRFIEGDIRDPKTCRRACAGVDYVLHQAALGSVPRSISDPLDSHAGNVTGFINMLDAARAQKVRRFVYASSSAVYGDEPVLPKVENKIGRCLSPYAVTKRVNELYADVFALCYGIETIGLRYFNVFGPRQDPDGPYAAVIPKWIAAMIQGQPVVINGDGTTSRDFCYVANVVQANLLAACVKKPQAVNQVFNVAIHARTTLNQLFAALRESLLPHYPHLRDMRPTYRDFRAGDVLHSEANVSKATRLLGYKPAYTMEKGLAEALNWYRSHLS
jgi:UDP-N-acetylglucosamine 4-epimerase